MKDSTIYEDVLDTIGLERELGIGDTTLRKWRASGRIPEPDCRVGRRPYWRVETIRRWVANGGTLAEQGVVNG